MEEHWSVLNVAFNYDNTYLQQWRHKGFDMTLAQPLAVPRLASIRSGSSSLVYDETLNNMV